MNLKRPVSSLLLRSSYENKIRQIGEHLLRKFTDDEEYIRKEVTDALPRAQCLELTIDHMTGKLVKES